MIKKLKKYVLTTVAALSLLLPVVAPALVHAQSSGSSTGSSSTGGGLPSPSVPPNSGNLRDNFCNGVDISVSNGGACDTSTANDNINNAVKLGLNLFSAIVGIISVVMIIIGGIKYITSGGDSGNVTSAKNTIMYAVIGLVVVALAQIIVKFVLGRFTQ